MEAPQRVPSPPVRSVSNVIFYEANFQTLTGGNKLRALDARLDDIAALSVNVLWLMPIHPIGVLKSVGSPYCVRDYWAVNPDLGSLADLEQLVADAHRRGISVILDWVANHTAWDNPWISHRDWYTQDAQGNIVSPPGFNWPDVADLNYNATGLRNAMIEAMEYWVDTVGIDGFRCDAADFVPDDFWAQAIAAVNVHAGRSLVWLAEGSHPSLYQDGFALLYGWTFSDTLLQVFQGKASPQALSGLEGGQTRLLYTTNHDKAAWDGSPVALYGSQDAALAAFAAAVFSGGPPLVYGSQEVGFPTTVSFFGPQPVDWTAHPEVRQEYQRLLALRASSPAAQTGVRTDLSAGNLLAFRRTAAQDSLIFAAALGSQPATLTVPAGSWVDTTGASIPGGTALALPPGGYRILLSP
jgi:glycosidase